MSCTQVTTGIRARAPGHRHPRRDQGRADDDHHVGAAPPGHAERRPKSTSMTARRRVPGRRARSGADAHRDPVDASRLAPGVLVGHLPPG